VIERMTRQACDREGSGNACESGCYENATDENAGGEKPSVFEIANASENETASHDAGKKKS
jgi:hypothetical protein